MQFKIGIEGAKVRVCVCDCELSIVVLCFCCLPFAIICNYLEMAVMCLLNSTQNTCMF